MADQESSKRQVAFRIKIADIINRRYVKEEGWLPNYIEVGEKKVSRANLLGVIVSKDVAEGEGNSHNFILDDGSAKIPLRFFDQPVEVVVGDIVTVIGRPREFGTERYVVPEVIKKITDPKWVQLRKLELAKDCPPEPEVEAGPIKEVVADSKPEDDNPMNKVVKIIRELDDGAGAGFEDISSRFGDKSPEDLVQRLLEQGDVFEVKPGRYKILE